MKKIIIIKERSNGNATIGDMWLETKSFPETTSLKDVLEWQSAKNGKLIITIDDAYTDENPF